MAPKNKTKGTRRKDEVVVAAAALFADQGFAAVGMDDIGERAGITGPAIYNHFDSKEELLGAVILNASQRLAQIADAMAADRTGDARQDLRKLVTATTAAALELGDATQVYVREVSRLRPQDREAVQAADARLLKLSREMISAVVPDLPLASFGLRSAVVMGATASAAREPSIQKDPRLQAALVEAALAVFETPVAAPPQDPQRGAGSPAPWLFQATRRDEILNVAARLFAERGYHAVSMEDIGAAAGISAAAIYRHFPNKAGIANEAFSRVGSRVIVSMELVLRQAASPDEALEGLVEAFANEAIEAGDLLSVLSQTIRELDAENAARELSGRRQILDTWTHVLKVARPELQEPMARLLARAGIAAVTQAAQVLPFRPPIGELKQLTLALLRS